MLQRFLSALSLLCLFVCLCNGLTNIAPVGTHQATSTNPSGTLPGLLGPRRGSSLAVRQFECSAGPGGPICSPTTCCAAGQICCPTDCCRDDQTCFGANQCCPIVAQTCGGTTCCETGAECCSSASTGCCQAGDVCCSQSPTGCCIAGGACCQGSKANPCCGPGESCCGNTCCPTGEICERNECVSKGLIDSGRVVRFELDWKKNGLLLRNMCNGMRGKNTDTLTYTKISKSAKAKKRRAAGCISKYCRGLINSGKVTSDLNSCDEYPPASSAQGGNTLPAIERAINCIPDFQNTFQGSMFGNMVTRSGIQDGEQFVISIDCEEVLNSINQRRDLAEPVLHESKRNILKTRDSVSASGTSNSNDTFNLQGDPATYITAPFGDLDPGSYTAQAQVVSGSTINGTVIANEGDTYANSSQGMSAGQSQQFTFTLDDADVGLGVVFSASGNDTVIKWTLEGTLSPTSTATSPSTASPTGVSSTTGTAASSASILLPSFMRRLWGIFVMIMTASLLSL